jgi:hypothetical protein
MQASLRSLHKFGCAPRLEGWPQAPWRSFETPRKGAAPQDDGEFHRQGSENAQRRAAEYDRRRRCVSILGPQIPSPYTSARTGKRFNHRGRNYFRRGGAA